MKNRFPLYLVQINLEPPDFEPHWVNLEEIIDLPECAGTEKRLCAYLDPKEAKERAKETDHLSRVIAVNLRQADAKTISSDVRVIFSKP